MQRRVRDNYAFLHRSDRSEEELAVANFALQRADLTHQLRIFCLQLGPGGGG